MKLFLDMNERFPPVHLVTLDCLLDLETDLNRIYPTSMSEAARIRTIQTGIIAQYTISEREEIARIVKMNPDLACSITRAKNVADFVEQVKNAYEKIRWGEINYQKTISKQGDMTEIRDFEWTSEENRLKTATLTHSMNAAGESSNVIDATFYHNPDAHLIFGR
jgi:hypothetical protein